MHVQPHHCRTYLLHLFFHHIKLLGWHIADVNLLWPTRSAACSTFSHFQHKFAPSSTAWYNSTLTPRVSNKSIQDIVSIRVYQHDYATIGP